ncbi:MAG: hypothetical protein JWO05_2462 [Gemmatimonadetes bacterium]|nr:hypothetical protein [Gemmatimonadota bacterium]
MKHSRNDRRGFSLVEVMIAMTLLAIILTSLAKLQVLVSSRGTNNEISTMRNAKLNQLAAFWGGIPYDSLSKQTVGTTVFTTTDFPYTRRITRTASSNGKYYTITLVVVPTRDATKKDSVVITRSQATTANPLCSGC